MASSRYDDGTMGTEVIASDQSKSARLKGFAAAAMLAAALPFLAACGSDSQINTKTKFSSSEYGVTASPRLVHGKKVPKGGGRYQVGKPYQVAGKWYTPAEDPNYSAIGLASWYGPNFHGRMTANGEIFDMNGISAAHPTLPLPSYVRVTNMANGRSMIVRVNDRGPYAHGRVIDLSSRVAEMLDFRHHGTAKVKVDYVGRAPLNGDDTRYLMASLNSPAVPPLARPDAGQTIRVATRPVRKTISFLSAIGDLLAFNEADDATVNSLVPAAHAAAEMAGRGDSLRAWQQTTDLEARTVNMGVGAFVDAAEAEAVGKAFARLASVEMRSVEKHGQPATEVRVDTLKEGVTRSDVVDLTRELGLQDIVLY